MPMPAKRYDLIDTTADIGIRAYGKSLPDIFESCAVAMFDITSDICKVESRAEIFIKLDAPELDMLLVDFLNKFLYYKDTQNFVFASCSVTEIKKEGGKYMLCATARGEVFEAGKHVAGKDVKAATYHRLEINEKDGYATVIFDI
jgi:SHS2 domain-containing protein